RTLHREGRNRLGFTRECLPVALRHTHIALDLVVESGKHGNVICLLQRDRERRGVVEDVERAVPLSGALAATLCVRWLISKHFVAERLEGIDEAGAHTAGVARDGQG